MTSREQILSAVKNNQPAFTQLPELRHYAQSNPDHLQQFIAVLTAIGGNAHRVSEQDEMISILNRQFPLPGRRISINGEWPGYAINIEPFGDPHLLGDVDIAIIQGHFGVAENGSIWVTEKQMGLRVVPFICQHLVAVVDADQIVPTMSEAYDRIVDEEYAFGTFIAGPSKTADIEQSLVLGAHGPKTMTVFLK